VKQSFPGALGYLGGEKIKGPFRFAEEAFLF
jgi:hypothetical protein